MIVELAGTPCAGKDSVIRSIVSNGEIAANFRKVVVVDESIKRVANRGDPYTTNFKSVAFSLQDLRRIHEDPEHNDNLYIINRGLFDRMAFIRLFGPNNGLGRHFARNLESHVLFANEIIDQNLIFLFLTSAEKAIARKQLRDLRSGPFAFVNEEVITRLNGHYWNLYYELYQYLPIVLMNDETRNMSLAEKSNAVAGRLRRVCSNILISRGSPLLYERI